MTSLRQRPANRTCQVTQECCCCCCWSRLRHKPKSFSLSPSEWPVPLNSAQVKSVTELGEALKIILPYYISRRNYHHILLMEAASSSGTLVYQRPLQHPRGQSCSYSGVKIRNLTEQSRNFPHFIQSVGSLLYLALPR